MQSGSRQTAILRNIQADECVPKGAEDLFFSSLAAGGTPSDAGEAHELACKIVCDDYQNLTCLGMEVDAEIFGRLVRFERPSNLVGRLMPDDAKAAFLARYGLTEGDFEKQPWQEQRQQARDYDGPLELGSLLHIVWVADGEECEILLSDLPALVDRLGLGHLVKEAGCVILKYRREDIPHKLRVPRALDGIDNPRFEVVADCSQPYGKTKPLSEDTSLGLREAVHREQTLEPGQVEIDVGAMR